MWFVQNHCRDLRPGYDHLLRYWMAAQAIIAYQSASFRRCYGPEYVGGKLTECAEKRNTRLEYIQQGKPQQIAYIERYNRTARGEWLVQYFFETIEEAQAQATERLWTYTNERPTMGIGGMTPAMKLKTAA